MAISRVSLRPLSGPSISASQAAREGGLSMPGVDQREARAVLDEIEIDVIEPERQREPRPKIPGRTSMTSPALGGAAKGNSSVCGLACEVIGAPCSPSPRVSRERLG